MTRLGEQLGIVRSPERRAGLGKLLGIVPPDEPVKRADGFPPPPPGSIPQGRVMPEAIGDEASPLGLTKAVLGEYYRNVAGAVVAPVQALRHPIATGVGTVAGTAGGLMSLAELATPLDAGNFPGHQAVQGAIDWSKERIASDAPFEEAGQYAAAVPDLVGIAAPLAGVTKIPGVSQALSKVAAPIGKGAKFLGKTVVPPRLAAAGRAVLEQFPKPYKLLMVDTYLKFPDTPDALKYIDDPKSAPTQRLKDVAEALNLSRKADHKHWSELSFPQRTRLANLGHYEESVSQQYQDAAARLKLEPFASTKPITPAQTKARSPKIRPGQAPLTLSQHLYNARIEAKNQARNILERYILPGVDYAFSRPGTKSGLAARYVGPEAKRALKKGIPAAVEAAEGERRALAAQMHDHRLSFVDQIRKDADGDLDEMTKMGKAAYFYYTTGSSKVPLSAELERIIDAAKLSRRARLEETAAQGLLDPGELQRLRDPKELFAKVYSAAHDKSYVNEARKTAIWGRTVKLIRRYNRGASDSEVIGSIERMLNTELANVYERTGLLPASKAGFGGNPLLANVMRTRTGRSALRAAAEELYGPIRDLPAAWELSGEVLSRTRAKNLMNRSLIEDFHVSGLASSKEEAGYENLRKVLRLSSDAWVPRELVDVFKEGEHVAKDMGVLVRGLTKAGAAWRAGSTVYSPTTAIQNSLSSMFGISGMGDMYRAEFFPAMRHALRQGFSAIGRGGQAAGSRSYEEALALRNLGGGTVSGEYGQIMTELGMTPRVRGSIDKDVPQWMVNWGMSPKNLLVRKASMAGRRAKQFARDVFEQGDVIPKRVVSQLIASDYEAIAKAGTPGDLENVMKGIYGSTDPGVIAADMTSNGMQSYNRVPQLWRDIGRGPLMGLFSAFPAESLRNFQWQARYLAKSLKGAAIAESPVVRKILLERSMRSIGGMSINLRFLSEMGEIAEEAIGPELSEQQQEAIRTLAVPEWDRGPMAVLSRKKGMLTYAPAGNLEYFQGPRRLLELAGKLAGHIARGETEYVDQASVDILQRLSDDLLQFQQPTRGIAEGMFNQRIPPSPVSLVRERLRDRTPAQITSTPISTQGAKDILTKAILPGVLPTPARQIIDMIKWGTAPPGEENVGRSPREVSPFKVKTTDTLQQMGIAGGRYADEKVSFNSRIKRINEKPISPQEKADLISELRKDWYEDFGARLAREVPLWRSLHSRAEVLAAMKTLGHASAVPAMRGQVPDFYQVFGNSIPGLVKFYMGRK